MAKLGEVGSAEDAVDAMNSNSDTVDIGKAQGKSFVEAAESGASNRRHINVDGVLYGVTVKAYRKLNGPIPEEPPPLTGDSLREAEEYNAKLAEDVRRANEEGSK